MRHLLLNLAFLLSGMAGSFAFFVALRFEEGLGTIDALQSRVAARPEPRRPNVITDFNSRVEVPDVGEGSWVDPMSSVIGHVALGERVYVGPFASVRGDEGQPIHIGDDTNVQDGVVVHALETESHGEVVPGRTYSVDGHAYAVYIGERVSLAHQSLVHGPARVDDDVFVGMQAMVFKASVGAGTVIEPGAKVIGVDVPAGRYVPAGAVVTTQAAADALPAITETYAFRDLNDAVVHVNTSFAASYQGLVAAPITASIVATVGHGKPAAH